MDAWMRYSTGAMDVDRGDYVSGGRIPLQNNGIAGQEYGFTLRSRCHRLVGAPRSTGARRCASCREDSRIMYEMNKSVPLDSQA